MSIDAGPMDAVRAGLLSALEAEEERYDSVLRTLESEHNEVVGHIQAALARVEGGAAIPVATNGHAAVAPSVPVVDPDDEVVDPSTATVKEMCRALMATRRGEIWTAQQLLGRLEALGYSGGADSKSRLATIRATLSQMFRDGEVTRPTPGDYILP